MSRFVHWWPLLAALLFAMEEVPNPQASLNHRLFLQLPFLRWKKYPILAAGCIFVVRAVLVQIGFYLHMQVSSAWLTQ